MQTDFAIGHRDLGNRSYLSTLVEYRTVAAADASGPGAVAVAGNDVAMSLPGIIHLEARLGETEREVRGSLSDFGRSSYLALFVQLGTAADNKIHTGLLSSGSRADVLVWQWCGGEGAVFSDDATDLQDNSKWCLLHAQSVTCSTVIQLRDIPALPIVVTVPTLSAPVGTATILYRRNE